MSRIEGLVESIVNGPGRVAEPVIDLGWRLTVIGRRIRGEKVKFEKKVYGDMGGFVGPSGPMMSPFRPLREVDRRIVPKE